MTKPDVKTKNEKTPKTESKPSKARKVEDANVEPEVINESEAQANEKSSSRIGASAAGLNAIMRKAMNIGKEPNNMDIIMTPSDALQRSGKIAGKAVAGNVGDVVSETDAESQMIQAVDPMPLPAAGGGGGKAPSGPARATSFFCECYQTLSSRFRALLNWFTVVVIVLLGLAALAVGKHISDSYTEAMAVMHDGPVKAYTLEEKGQAENAKRVWAQVSARSGWLGWFDGQDAPYLQRTVLAYKAQDWQRVTEFGYKALERPITDRQAVAVQQMLLDATANLVRAYLPNQQDQPIRGGVPDHAAPVCDAKTNVWIAPLVLLAMALLCLWGKMRVGFAVLCLMIPAYFAGVSEFDGATRMRCEARLAFNPDDIVLVAGAPSKGTSNAFAAKSMSPSGPGVVTIEPSSAMSEPVRAQEAVRVQAGHWMGANPAVVQPSTGGRK